MGDSEAIKTAFGEGLGFEGLLAHPLYEVANAWVRLF
jgi:hypothetical protein